MADKKRYLVAHRYGPRLDPKSAEAIDSLTKDGKEMRQVRATPVGRRVVEMTPQQMRDLRDRNPQLVVEEDRPLELFGPPGLAERVPSEGRFSAPVVVKDATNDAPIQYVSVYAVGDGVAYKAVTDEQGQAVVQTAEKQITRIIATARDTYWSAFVDDVTAREGKGTAQPTQISLKPLLTTGAYDWGPRLMNFRQAHQYWTGKEVRIGVIDSGVAQVVTDYTPKGGVNTLDGQDVSSWNVDENGHGTHCAGIVAACNTQLGIAGGAPDADVYALKVFPGGYLSDLIEAIEWGIRERMDVISMSLGSSEYSQVLEGVLRDAYDRGITCVAAAGNGATHVAYPAAFASVIAVSALGRVGTFPEDSAHQLAVGRFTDQRGGLFAARFTNFGPEVGVCAPGVAILSTLPTGYGAWDGTSMACPLISALAALVLQAYPDIRTGDPQQVEYVRGIIQGAAVDLGMPREVQGAGLPLASAALEQALGG